MAALTTNCMVNLRYTEYVPDHFLGTNYHCLWNELLTELRLPRHTQSSPPSPSVAHGSSSPPPSPLSVTTSVFHSELKTWLFGKSFLP